MPDPRRQIKFYLHVDIEKLATAYAMETGWGVDESREFWENENNTAVTGTAVSGRKWIIIKATSPESRGYSLRIPGAHEIAHAAYQSGLLGLATDPTATAFDLEVTEPRWLSEGIAILYTDLALLESGSRDYLRDREWRVEFASATDLSLRDAEVWPEQEEIPSDERNEIIQCIESCGALAAELLASHVGLGNLSSYYIHMEPPTDSNHWRLAFDLAFGMTVGEFYELFEAYRAAGFPEPACEKVASDAGPSGGRAASPDRQVLVTLFNATCGPNWTESEGWLTGAPIGEWHGVTVDRTGRVIELNLQENGLRSEIPPELGNLVNLTHLAFYSNGLSGEIPPELGGLVNATQILLYDTQLTGHIPPELGSLTNLRVLEIGWNQLSGEIPPELGNLTNLEGLSLEANQLKGEIPPELGSLNRLKWLVLTGNQLTGCVPGSLQGRLDPAHGPGMPFC